MGSQKSIKVIIALLLSFIIPLVLYADDLISIKLISKFELDQKEPIGRAWGFAVDENENIYLPDSPNGNIKIYDNKGKLIRIFGRRGAGPDEFVKPIRIDVDSERICIQDPGLFRYIIYDRKFYEIARFFYLISGNDNYVLNGERIITNGNYKSKDGKEFKGVVLDLHGNMISTLLPFDYPQSDAWNRITDAGAFLDFSKNGDIFLVKTSNVKFYKFSKHGNLNNNFGKNPSYFISCKKTEDFNQMERWGRAKPGIDSGEKWYSSFSWVSGLFVLDDILGIPIRTYEEKIDKWECYLEFYDFEGKLLEGGIKLKEVGDSSYNGFYIDSNHKNSIYILEINEDIDPPQYTFFKYDINP